MTDPDELLQRLEDSIPDPDELLRNADHLHAKLVEIPNPVEPLRDSRWKTVFIILPALFAFAIIITVGVKFDSAVFPTDTSETPKPQTSLDDSKTASKADSIPSTRTQYSRPEQWPVTGGKLSSPFGKRLDPFFHRKWEFHSGIDIAAPLGTPVLAAGGGRIIEIGYGRLTGNRVVIDHGNGIKSVYFHLLRVADSHRGDTVKKGDRIGYVGERGRSTGPHLHFEIIKDEHHVDPIPFLHHINSQTKISRR